MSARTEDFGHELPPRPAHAFDGLGTFVASFVSVDKAHAWAHREVAAGTVAPPVEIHDRDARTVIRVSVGFCEELGLAYHPLRVLCATPVDGTRPYVTRPAPPPPDHP